MTNRTRIIIVAGAIAGLLAIAGCTATDAMWYDTTPGYTAGTVYYRPGTTTPYYDYGPSYYYYDPYPYGVYNFGFRVRDRDDHRGHFEGRHAGGHRR